MVVRRLEAAYKLLKEGKESVSEVCWSVDFHSRSYFTTAFKRQYNILPSDITARGMTYC
ncbi:helix-turn-helix domain-containing protein [Parabacteroides timonensis]|uniref:helix-turn-helix domain-containing protein n=1 Tax=Parabacteroides timonensis TaxID=1871013 RepID=UPI001F4895E9|nr:helix-turn-helix domain-containing protein [Parabacteroides timonensis]